MIKEFAINRFPDSLFSLIGSIYWILHPRKKFQIMYPSGGCLRIISRDEQYYTFKHSIGRGGLEKQRNKYLRYTKEGFCEIDQDDVVVDVGAFIGEFTLPAARRAKYVMAIEPDPQTFRCLSSQISNYGNILAVNELPYESHTELIFKSADDKSESSIINVDQGSYSEVKMATKTLDSILMEHSIPHVNYLKLDAEGAEPEVLRGLSEIPVDKLAIDVGEERKGASTQNEVTTILTSRGYEVMVEESDNGTPVLFAKM